jgi:hypothetical protein
LIRVAFAARLAAGPIRLASYMPSFIFTTQRLRRVYPPDKVVIDDISLAFYLAAKIGVIGGSG